MTYHKWITSQTIITCPPKLFHIYYWTILLKMDVNYWNLVIITSLLLNIMSTPCKMWSNFTSNAIALGCGLGCSTNIHFIHSGLLQRPEFFFFWTSTSTQSRGIKSRDHPHLHKILTSKWSHFDICFNPLNYFHACPISNPLPSILTNPQTMVPLQWNLLLYSYITHSP